MGRVQRRNASKQIVPRDDELERELRMHFLVTHCRVLDGDNDGLKLFFRLLELLVKFYDLLEGRDLFFRLSRFVESSDQLLSVRYAFAANLDRLGFFCGDRKSAARLQCFLG